MKILNILHKMLMIATIAVGGMNAEGTAAQWVKLKSYDRGSTVIEQYKTNPKILRIVIKGGLYTIYDCIGGDEIEENKFTSTLVTNGSTFKSTLFLREIMLGLRTVESNNVGNELMSDLAVYSTELKISHGGQHQDEILRKESRLVIIPNDFLLRLCEVINLKSDITSRITAKESELIKLTLEMGCITKELDQSPDEFLRRTLITIINQTYALSEHLRVLNHELVSELQTASQQKLIPQELLECFRLNDEGIRGLRTIQQQGSCFKKEGGCFAQDVISISRFWRSNSKLFIRVDEFENFDKESPIIEMNSRHLDVVLFHELNHYRHSLKYSGQDIYGLNLSNNDGCSSLSVLTDDEQHPIKGIFDTSEEELQLTGFTKLDNGQQFFDRTNELRYRLTARYDVRFPYQKPEGQWRWLLKAAEKKILRCYAEWRVCPRGRWRIPRGMEEKLKEE